MAESDSKAPQQTSGLARWTPSIPTNLMSMLNPFAGEDDEKAVPETTTSTPPSNKKQSIFTSFLSSPTPAGPPSPDKDEDIMFAEPDTRCNSDDGSREGSVDEGGRRPSKRSNKPKTCYSICHPPPASSTRQKLHRRPRSLLQLHKLSPNARPFPAFEVIPSASFSVRLTRAITKVFKTKHGLCPNDLVILRAEKYAADEPDEDQEAKDIIALICKGRKDDGAAPGKAKICLPDGHDWEAYPTLNGGYEFFSTDEHGLGLTVRWVLKKNKDGSKSTEPNKKKFNFSTISPNSRRHPVIATLGKAGLDVNDTYRMPDAADATPIGTPKQDSTLLGDTMEEEASDPEHRETTDQLRQLIVMTGIWVAFKEGWSPYFKYDDKEKDLTAVQRSPSLQYSPIKSGPFAFPSSTPPGSPGMEPLQKTNSMTKILRSGSLLSKGNRTSVASVPELELEDSATQPDLGIRIGRTRADSASTVLVHRAASNRAKNSQATWRPDLLSSQREMRESSAENSPASVTHNAAPSTVDPPSPTPQRRESIARPILPSPHESVSKSNESVSAAAMPRSVGQLVSPQKRGSSNTTTTHSSVSDAPQKASAPKKKRGGLRRLLCGGGSDV